MPILHPVEQRSEAWDLLRLGIPTASLFHMIVTPTGKSSAQWETLADHLLAERYLRRHVDSYTSPHMERGALVEEQAIKWYEFDQDVETVKVGFITSDEYVEDEIDGHWWYRYGASPDRLVGSEGLLEIKAPTPATQMKHLRTGKIAQSYRPQLQGQLWVSGRQWVDIVSWHEELPRIVVREERDEKFVEVLEREVTNFAAEVDRVYRSICAASKPSQRRREFAEMLRASLEGT